jgi:hypothetical protein
LVNPVRKVTNCGTKKNIGLFSSYKNMTGIWYESLIERDYMYLLESDPDVLSYSTQPLKIIYTWDNKPRKYTPDFLVERSSRTQIVEIKPATQVDSDKNQRLWRYVAPNCLERGWEFAVVTDEMIRVQPLLDNLKLLYKYVREPLSFHNYIECHQYFQRQGTSSITKAETDLAPHQISRKTLLKLIFLGWLSTDLMQPLSGESLIRLTQVKQD